MITKKIIAIIILFSLLLFSCNAQKYLALDSYKITGFKRIYFHEGDNICFRIKGDNIKYKAEILQINDSTIILKDRNVPINIVDAIYRDRSNFLTRSFSKVFIWGGLGFVFLDTFNNAITQSETIVDKRAVIAGGSLVAAGFIIKMFAIKKYKIGNKRMLKVLGDKVENGS
ncbi:MAG: hypothetical protein ACXVPU_09795 [Bacteroidia bacterium]